jgi:ATP-binding cassette subfamily B protein
VEVLSEIPDIDDENADKTAFTADNSVGFDNVSFSYGKGPGVLRSIDLHIASGQTVGIVGGTVRQRQPWFN